MDAPSPARTPDPAAPPARFDVVALLVALAVVPTLLMLRGGPVGQPVLDDHWFLHRLAFGGPLGWLDGMGHEFYWRPLTRQLDFLLVAPLLERAPWAIAAVHATLLAGAGLLLYAAFRRALPAPAAAAAATFPLMLEGSRTVLAWASGMQDLGALVAVALALFAASRGRLALAMVAALAGLLAKEVVLPVLLLLPFAPFPALAGRRRRWGIAIALLVLAWAAAYGEIRRHAQLASVGDTLPALHAPGTWPALVARALGLGVRDGLNLLDAPPLAALALCVAALALVGLGLRGLRRGEGDARAASAWSAWGALVFVLTLLPMVAILPNWGNFRLLVPAMGLGLALAPLAALAHRHAPLALVGVRLAGLLLATPATGVPSATDNTDESGVWNYARLSRLQRLTTETRAAFLERKPADFRGGSLVLNQFPQGVIVFVDHSFAPQLWARDTTVRHRTIAEWRAAGSPEPVVVLQYEPDASHPVAALDVGAVQAYEAAVDSLNAQRWAGALAALDAAAAAQRDPRALVMLAQIDAKRAVAEHHLGREADSKRHIAGALARYPAGSDPRFVAAQLELELRGDDAARTAGAER